MEKYLYPDPNDPSAQREGSQDTQDRQEQLKKRLEALKKKLAEMGLQQDGQKGQRGRAAAGQQGQGQDGDQDGDDGFDAAENAWATPAIRSAKAMPMVRQHRRARLSTPYARACRIWPNSMGGQQQGEGPEKGRRRGPRPGCRTPAGQRRTDRPAGSALRGKEYSDDYTVKITGEIDAQRARRILEELRRA